MTVQRYLTTLNAKIVALQGVEASKREVAIALGSSRRCLQRWRVFALLLLATNVLTLSALWVFVTPASFRAFREGIAIQLIRTGGHSMFSLQMRRAFGIFVERLLYEAPLALIHIARWLPLIGVPALAVAAVSRVANDFDDIRAATFWIAVANIAFLGDDLGLRSAPQLFVLAVFAIFVAIGILALPQLARKIAPASTGLWRRCRDAALGRARQPPEDAGFYLTQLQRQRQQRLTQFSWTTACFVLIAATAGLLDTVIVHE